MTEGSELRFMVDPKRMTVNDMILVEDIQEGQRRYRTWRSLLSRFLIDDNDKYIDEKEATRIIGQLTLDELGDAITAFTEALRRKAIPPAKSGD